MASRIAQHRRFLIGTLLIGSLIASLGLTPSPVHAQIDPIRELGVLPVAGTWARDSHDAVAWVDLARWTLVTSFQGAPVFSLAEPEPMPWYPVAGDWDGDGIDTLQMFNRSDWRLVPAEKGPIESAAEAEPEPNPWIPVAGDWDGDGRDSVLVFDQRDGSLHRLEEGPIRVVGYDPQPNPWIPVAGDWDGHRIDTLATFRLEEPRESAKAVWTFLSGDWDGDGIDTDVAIYLPSGELVVPELEGTALRSVAESSSSPVASGGSLDSLFAEGGGGGGGCYTQIKNWNQWVKVFHYGGGGCMVLVTTTWTEVSCCNISQNGWDYACSSKLRVKSQSYGYSNC